MCVCVSRVYVTLQTEQITYGADMLMLLLAYVAIAKAVLVAQ